MAFAFAWAKRTESGEEQKVAKGFLANEERALNFYRVFSFAYDTLNPSLYTHAMRKEIVNQVLNRTDLRVLDVGCGTGYTTTGVLTRKDVSEVVALDMNSVQLKRAARNLAAEKARTSISKGDADNLPFVNGCFDMAVSVGAVEYFPKPEKVLVELARVTKPGGVVVVGGPESVWFSKIALNRVFYTPSREEMERIFRTTGLVEVQTRLTGMKTIFGTGKYVVYTVGRKMAA